MYSPVIIERTLDQFEAENGWRPVRHSLGEVENFNAYIDSLMNVERGDSRTWYAIKAGTRITSNRRAEIRRWIENEQFLCFADANYWKTRYGWLCNEKSDVMRYVPRKSQQVFHQIIEYFDELQVAIELFVMKSRQVGISTEVALDFLQRILFIPHTQAVMASVKGTQSDLLARMLEVCWERQPFWLIPGRTSTKASMPQWANGSILSIQSGSQAMGIAQGWTPSCIHISELADIPRPKKVLEEGLFPATHSTAKLFFVMEGTGGDATGWQADKWKYYKENWGKGGRFMPTFIPWPCASDIYPPADWLRKQPIPEMWQPREETKRMRRKAELYIQSTDYLARVMGANWTMPQEQQWFWETKYNEALASHTVKVFLSQFPVSDDEALQSKNDRVFSDEVIAEVMNRSEKQYQSYAVTGQSVLIGQSDEPYEPPSDEIDYNLPRIPVCWESKNGQMNYWELIPLKPFDDTDDNMCFNRLLVFKQPEDGEDYSIGIDTADGLGNKDEERAVSEVVLNRAGNQRDEQVAEFVSIYVNPPQMVSIAACLGAWYGQWRGGRPYTKDPRGVKYCIEQRMRAGDDCQFQLKLMGFNYHHQFVSYDGKDVSGSGGSKLGWFSNVWSVPMLVNRFVDAVNGGWIKINSPMSLRQLSSYVRKVSGSGKSKLDHESGHFDDNIRALAQAYFTRHSHDVLVNRQTLKYQSHDNKLPPVSMDWIENRVQV